MEPIDFEGLAYKLECAEHKMQSVIEKGYHFHVGYQSGDLNPIEHIAFLNHLLAACVWGTNKLLEIQALDVPMEKCSKTLAAISRLLSDVSMVPCDYDQVLDGIV